MTDATPDHYDAIVVGSGFGGSVAALRLCEKGYRVLLLEKGKRGLRKEACWAVSNVLAGNVNQLDVRD